MTPEEHKWVWPGFLVRRERDIGPPCADCRHYVSLCIEKGLCKETRTTSNDAVKARRQCRAIWFEAKGVK